MTATCSCPPGACHGGHTINFGPVAVGTTCDHDGCTARLPGVPIADRTPEHEEWAELAGWHLSNKYMPTDRCPDHWPTDGEVEQQADRLGLVQPIPCPECTPTEENSMSDNPIIEIDGIGKHVADLAFMSEQLHPKLVLTNSVRVRRALWAYQWAMANQAAWTTGGYVLVPSHEAILAALHDWEEQSLV